MNKVYTAWAIEGEKHPHCLVEGEEPLRFNDGSTDPDCQIALWRIEACTWEEASAIYHIRQGWEPYKPEGQGSECPECGRIYYPDGSGECWNCGHRS